MGDWRLVFESTKSAESTVTIETCAEIVSKAIGAAVTTEVGEFHGNPRDLFNAYAWVKGTLPGTDIALTLEAPQWSSYSSGANPSMNGVYITLAGAAASSPAKLAAWDALREGFSGIDYEDRTLAAATARIVDDIESTGDTATGARLRTAIRETLVARGTQWRVVYLVDTRVDDIEAVLAAYPAHMEDVTLENCKLGALPAGVGRFTNTRGLTFIDPGSDISALRTMQLPNLTKLAFPRSGIQRITRDDVAGLPSLAELDVTDSKLAELDPGVMDVCPRLTRIRMRFAPLKNYGALRELWPHVTWD